MVRQALAGDSSLDLIGLATSTPGCATPSGDDYGLVVGDQSGSRDLVEVRVPKFAPGVHA